MLNKLNSIPKPILAAIVLFTGVILIILNDPPKDACDAQLDLFFKSQIGKISSLKGTVGSLLTRTAKYCGKVKTYGGCVEFHETLRGIVKDLRVTSPECSSKVIANEKIQMILRESITLMVKSAWGESAPEPGPNVYGWMTMAEFSLFCSIKNLVYEHVEDEDWEGFVRAVISQLPKAQELSFTKAFERSLFSLRCESVYSL